MKFRRGMLICKILMLASLVVATAVTYGALTLRNTLSEAEAIIVGLSMLVTVVAFRVQDSIRDKHKTT